MLNPAAPIREVHSPRAIAGASHEPTLHCPNCNHEIRLTESLAAPLLAKTRQRFNEQLAAKDAEVARKTEAPRKEQTHRAGARAD